LTATGRDGDRSEVNLSCLSALPVVLVLVAACGGGESEPPGPDGAEDPCEVVPASTLDDAALVQSLEQALATGFDGASAPGVAAHVVVPGAGTWFGARGVVDVPKETPITPSAVFRIGSITKTFTASAIFQLVEEGKLALDDPIDDHVPGWDFGPEVTIERLLEHTSGIYNYTDDPGFLVGATEDVTPEEVIDFAVSHGPLFEPGTDYTYSNTGYFLLGLAIEAIEGKPYEVVVRERFLDPLDLASLYMEQYEPGRCPVTQGHVGFGTPITEGFSMTWAWAAGGLVGDVDDLCRWVDALLFGGVLEPATLEAMKTEGAHSAPPHRYSKGLMWRTDGGHDVVGHTGSTMGFNGELFIDPSTGVCVAVQTNDFFGASEPVSGPLWDALTASGR